MLRILKYMQACMHTAVLCQEFFVLNLASYIEVSASLHLVYTNTIWSMENGHYAAISGYLCRAQNSRSPNCVYEISEICITKKLQKLQAGKRQAVLQGSDSRWIRPWLTCCEKKWKRHQSFLDCHLTAGGHRGRDATIGKVEKRHYWPNYYQIKEKVHIAT